REPEVLLASCGNDSCEPLGDSSIDEGQCPPAYAIANRHFHEPGCGIAPYEHRPLGAGPGAEFGGDVLEQLLHRPGAMPDHRPDHRLEHVGVNVRWTGQEKLAERRDWNRVGRYGCGRCHALARSSSSTSPPIATSLVFTRL